MTFLKAFEEPASTWRPQPFFVWNGRMTRERITEMLEQYADNHCGGVFVHPRPGLVTEYLSEEWFELWEWTLSESERLGLECHFYDENSYPSGFAGGHTVARNPHTIGYVANIRRAEEPVKPGGKGQPELIAAWRALGDGPGAEALGEKVDFSVAAQASPEEPVWVVEMAALPARWWSAGFPQVDLLNPATTQTFLEVTHEAYAGRFGEKFGKTIKYAFADEPVAGAGSGLALSHYFMHEFLREHGYDVRDQLSAIFFDTKESAAVRFDYWSTVNRLFLENYVKPCHDWCAEHNLEFTGHFHETSWPRPRNQPSTMAALRWMQAPGNDLLGFQFYPTTLEENSIYLLNLKELGSIARQCGRERVLVESCGGGGYDYAPRDMKPLEDFLMSQGVNLINPHLSHSTLSGARKYDWPHTLSDHSPWWQAYPGHADHLTRCNAVLNQGVEENRVLLLHPDSSGWLFYNPHAQQGKKPEGVLDEIRQSQLRLVRDLNRAGIDFDLGDEFTLAEMGRITGGQLQVGECRYDAVIIPPGMRNALDSTAQLLPQLLDAGIALFAPSEWRLDYVNGRKDQSLSQTLRERLPAERSFGDHAALIQGLRKIVPPRIEAVDAGELPANLCWRRTARADQECWFFCNPFDEPLQVTLRLGEGTLLELDSIRAGQKGRRDAGSIHLDLPARGHALLVSEPADPGIEPQPPRTALFPAETARSVDAELARIYQPRPNCLMLDYCDLTVNGKTWAGINTIKADGLNWKEQGFPQNPWRVSIQYRRTFLDWPLRQDSGFTTAYHFQIAEDDLEEVRETLEIAMERPELYELKLNGKPLSQNGSRRWFDPEMHAVEIGPHVRAGLNTLEMTCRPFHPLAEIMPVYLLGYFTLEPVEQGFLIRGDQALELGDCTRQGRPFFGESYLYFFRFELEKPARALKVSLPDVEGSAMRVQVGQEERALLYPPYEGVFTGEFAAGRHGVKVVVASNLKNTLGPHFSDGLPGGWSWEQAPAHQPPGQEYRFYPVGLNAAPRIEVVDA
jgi:hypothetical protein